MHKIVRNMATNLVTNTWLQIRSTKSEIRNNLKCSNFKCSKQDGFVKSQFFSISSFLRKQESGYFNGFWTPAGVYPVLDTGPE